MQSQEEQVATPVHQALFQVEALYDFHANEQSELSFRKGEILDVTDDKVFKDWYTGRSATGLSGLFPTNYVKKLEAASTTATDAVDTQQQKQKIEEFKRLLENAKANPAAADHDGIQV